MAVLDPQTLIDQAQPWCCIPQGDMMLAVLAALVAVGEGEPMPNAQELMDQISCLRCALQPGDVPLAILGAVSNITSGGSGGGVTCGSGDPVAAPSGACGLYIDTDAPISLWGWDGAAWQQLIA